MENRNTAPATTCSSTRCALTAAHIIGLLIAFVFNLYLFIKYLESIRSLKEFIAQNQDMPDVIQQIEANLTTTQWQTVGVTFTTVILLWALVRQLRKYVKF